MPRYNIVHFVKISKFVSDLQCTLLIAEPQANHIVTDLAVMRPNYIFTFPVCMLQVSAND